jgi:hypothetical protein
MESEAGKAVDRLELVNRYKADLPANQITAKNKTVSPRKRRYDKFLCGPVPLLWLSMAAKCSGKALQLGIALWYLAGLTKSLTVKPTRSTLNLFGLSRWSVSRNLNLLELAGLVTVERRKGKASQVTIVEEPRSPVATDGETGRDTDV